MATLRSRLLVLGTALVTATAAQDCDYDSVGGSCISPEAIGSAEIEFEPAFSSPPTFVFAVDDLSKDDIRDMSSAKEVDVPSGEPVQAVAWWLEYDNSTASYDGSIGREYTVWALESNSTKDIGGGDGGCADLLGSECINDLKELFAQQNVTDSNTSSNAISEYLGKLYETPPARVNCPTIIWGDGSGNDTKLFGTSARPVLTVSRKSYSFCFRFSFAILTTRTDAVLLLEPYFGRLTQDSLGGGPSYPSGNASFTHGIAQMRFRSFEEQKSLAVIAFALSWPVQREFSAEFGEPPEIKWSRDNLTLDMACLRADKPWEDPDSAAPGKALKTSTVVLGVISAASVLLFT